MENYKATNRTIFDKIFDNRYFISFVVVIFTILTFIYISIAPKVYRSSAVLEISPKNNFINFTQTNVDLKKSYEVYLQNQMDLLQSKYLLSKVIKRGNFNIQFYKKNIFGFLKEFYDDTIFDIKYIKIKDENIYNKIFHLKKIDDKRYSISLVDLKNSSIKLKDTFNKEYQFGQKVSNQYLDLEIDKSNNSNIDEIYLSVLPIYQVVDKSIENLNIVRNGDKSSFLTLSFDSYNPQNTKKFLDTLLKVYLETIKKAKNSEFDYYGNILNDEIKKKKEKLNKIEAKIVSFSKKNKVAGLKKQTDNLLDTISKKEEKLSLLNSKLETLKMILRTIKYQHNYQDTLALFSDLDNKNLPILVNQIIEEEKRYNLNKQKYKDLHPQMVKLRKSIWQKETILKINLVKLYKDIKAKRDKLKRDILKSKKLLNTLPIKEINLDKLNRDYQQVQKEYLLLLDKKSNVTILKKIKQDYNYKIIDEAFIPTYPIKPKNTITLLLGIIFGFIFGIILAFIKDFFRQKIITIGDIEDLTNKPILGFLPALKDTKDEIFVWSKPDSLESHFIWLIRNNLESYINHPSFVFAISSYQEGEDRDLIISNISASLGMGDKKTIILSLDFRTPKAYKSFDIVNQEGMSSILFEHQNINQTIKKIKNYKNLYIIPPGKRIGNPTNIINSKYLPLLIKELKKVFDYIVIEAGYISTSPETIYIMKYTDINIFTIKSKFSKKKFINIIEKILTSNKIENISYILTNLQANYLKKF